jgi:hypothetical protein
MDVISWAVPVGANINLIPPTLGIMKL